MTLEFLLSSSLDSRGRPTATFGKEKKKKGAPGTGMPAPSASCFQQPQQLTSIGAPGTRYQHLRLPVSSNHSPSLQPGLPAPGRQRPWLPVFSNHSSSLQMERLAKGCQRPPLPVSSNHSRTKTKRELQPSLACHRQLLHHTYRENKCRPPCLSSFP